MIVYEFRCKECDAVYETHVQADRLDSCKTVGCTGIPRRKWASNFIRSNIRAVPK